MVQFLEFKSSIESTNLEKLSNANFCKDRLCPMCSWRRSLKIFGQVSKIMDKLQEKNEYEFLFLTLTSKNVYGENLSEELDKLFYGIKKFMMITKIKKSKSYDTYHPHFHIILIVNKSYFNDKILYILVLAYKYSGQRVNPK